LLQDGRREEEANDKDNGNTKPVGTKVLERLTVVAHLPLDPLIEGTRNLDPGLEMALTLVTMVESEEY